MELENKCLRFGVLMIGCAVLFHLVGGKALGAFVAEPEVITSLLFLKTGRYITEQDIVESTEPTQPVQTAPATTQPPTEPTTPPPAQAVFAKGDAKLVEVNNRCGYSVDLQAMLAQPLAWDLTQERPTVLILHSHGTESYTKTADYQETSQYRTRDNGYNVVSVGDRIAELLEAGGISVIHDRTTHDYPSYNASYTNARKAIQKYLKEYPSICMVLDIHRDAVTLSDGSQASYTVSVDGQKAAQVMMVVGTDAGGAKHPNWESNMALAVKLHAQLEKTVPGICRPISFRTQRFNQDTSAGAMLIEVGAAGNTHDQAMLAAEQVARGILALAGGTEQTLY